MLFSSVCPVSRPYATSTSQPEAEGEQKTYKLMRIKAKDLEKGKGHRPLFSPKNHGTVTPETEAEKLENEI